MAGENGIVRKDFAVAGVEGGGGVDDDLRMREGGQDMIVDDEGGVEVGDVLGSEERGEECSFSSTAPTLRSGASTSGPNNSSSHSNPTNINISSEKGKEPQKTVHFVDETDDGLIPVITPNSSSIPTSETYATYWARSFHGDIPIPTSLDNYSISDPIENALKNNLRKLGGKNEAWKYAPSTTISPSPPPIPPPLPPTPGQYVRQEQRDEDDEDGLEKEPVYFDPYHNYRGQNDVPLPLSDKRGMLPVTITFGLIKGRNLSFVSQDFRWDSAGQFQSAFESQMASSNGLVYLLITNWQLWFLRHLQSALPEFPAQPVLHLDESRTTTMLPLMDRDAAQTSFVMEHIDTVPATGDADASSLKIGEIKTLNTPLVVWTASKSKIGSHIQRPIVTVLSNKARPIVSRIAEHYMQETNSSSLSQIRWNRLQRNQTWIYLDLGFIFTRWENVWGAAKLNLNTRMNDVYSTRKTKSILDQTRQLHIDNNIMISLREHLRIHKASLNVVIQRSKRPFQTNIPGDDTLTARSDDLLQLLDYYEVTANSLLEQQQNLLSLTFNLETVIQSQAVARLNVLAFVFLPLSFVASVFGITTFTAPPQWYPVAAVPTLVLTILVAYITNKIFTPSEPSQTSPPSDPENHLNNNNKSFFHSRFRMNQTPKQEEFFQRPLPLEPYHKKSSRINLNPPSNPKPKSRFGIRSKTKSKPQTPLQQRIPNRNPLKPLKTSHLTVIPFLPALCPPTKNSPQANLEANLETEPEPEPLQLPTTTTTTTEPRGPSTLQYIPRDPRPNPNQPQPQLQGYSPFVTPSRKRYIPTANITPLPPPPPPPPPVPEPNSKPLKTFFSKSPSSRVRVLPNALGGVRTPAGLGFEKEGGDGDVGEGMMRRGVYAYMEEMGGGHPPINTSREPSVGVGVDINIENLAQGIGEGSKPGISSRIG